jgi:four helix bundle protein
MEGADSGGFDKYSYYRSNAFNINPKSGYRNPKQIQMSKDTNSKPYDLEERTLKFAKDVRAFVKKLPKTLANIEDSRQLVKASGSVGANYIEANESISKKDFIFRIKICRKESKESRYWLRLLDTENDADLDLEREDLVRESTELMKIFGAILQKSK